jgi:hypothetical protein
MDKPSLTCIEKTCNDLDQLIVKYFETFTELCDLKQQLECTMKDGFLHMAKVSFQYIAYNVMSSSRSCSVRYNTVMPHSMKAHSEFAVYVSFSAIIGASV